MGSRFVVGHAAAMAAAMAVAIAKTQEAAEISDRRRHIDRAMESGFASWAENNRKQRRAAARDKKEFRLKGIRP